MKMLSKAELRSIVSKPLPYYFSEQTMNFFCSILETGGYKVQDKIYFITSEKHNRKLSDTVDPRLYTIRCFDLNDQEVYGKFQEYPTLDSAKDMLDSWIKEERFIDL